MKQTKKYIPNKKKSSLTLEDAYEMPEYESKKEVIGFLIKNKGKNLFPKKNLSEQKRKCRRKLEKKMEGNPDMNFKDLMADLLKGLPNDYPVEMIAPLIKYLSEHWMKKHSKELVS